LRYWMTREQTEILEVFRDRLQLFQNKVRLMDFKGDDLEIVSDPEWPSLVALASKATAMCRDWRAENCGCDGYALANFDLDE
jgi:hypothetical protein